MKHKMKTNPKNLPETFEKKNLIWKTSLKNYQKKNYLRNYPNFTFWIYLQNHDHNKKCFLYRQHSNKISLK